MGNKQITKFNATDNTFNNGHAGDPYNPNMWEFDLVSNYWVFFPQNLIKKVVFDFIVEIQFIN